MTTLNGLQRECDSFVRGICARRKLTKFNKLWEECLQEEGRISNKEERLNDNEYQALVTHSKNERNKRKSQGSPSRRPPDFKRGKRPRNDYSSFECYSCHKMGHIARNFPLKKDRFKKKNQKYHAHAAEENESDKERARENEDSTKEYVLNSSLTRSISHGSNTWIIDSDASNNMTSHNDSLFCLTQNNYSHKVQLGDDYQYPIKGMGEASYKLRTIMFMKMKEV